MPLVLVWLMGDAAGVCWSFSVSVSDSQLCYVVHHLHKSDG